MTKLRSEHLNDIEECITSRRLYHSDRYHDVSEEEKLRIQKELLDWYNVEKRTTMPWRKDTDKSWNEEVSIIFYTS